MKVKLFWEEVEQENYICREYGSLYGERFELIRTEPNLDHIKLEDLEYNECPVINALPGKMFYFTINRLDVQRIMERRPTENVLGIILEDLALILNRGHVNKFHVPLPEVEYLQSTAYVHPPRIVQMIGAHYVTGEEWPPEDVEKMQSAFKRHKAKLLELWGFEE